MTGCSNRKPQKPENLARVRRRGRERGEADDPMAMRQHTADVRLEPHAQTATTSLPGLEIIVVRAGNELSGR